MTWPEDVCAALLDGPWTEPTMLARVSHAVGRMTADAWTRGLVSALLVTWPAEPEAGAVRLVLAAHPEPVDAGWRPPPLPPPPAPKLAKGRLELSGPGPLVLTRTDLISLLDLTGGELDWFADRQSRLARGAGRPLQHYRQRVLISGDRVRVLEIPKPRLKEIQRRLLRHVVNRLPLHPAAHGSVPGGSVRSAVAGHATSAILVRCDLESFFTAITDDRVHGLLRLTGAEEPAVRLMTGLCTTVLPASMRRQLRLQDGDPARWRLERRLAVPHLPQGAPTSPGLANAIAYSLDLRLDALAHSLGGRYTRYVDDLIFSAGPGFGVGALLAGVRSIVTEEGFRLAERKTAVLRSSRRQQVLGVVVNAQPSIPRPELDRLRAILHNCRTRGVASQCGPGSSASLRAELTGKIAWVHSIDPRRGELLAAAAARIDWDS